jgi:hypothetical protein
MLQRLAKKSISYEITLSLSVEGPKQIKMIATSKSTFAIEQ